MFPYAYLVTSTSPHILVFRAGPAFEIPDAATGVMNTFVYY